MAARRRRSPARSSAAVHGTALVVTESTGTGDDQTWRTQSDGVLQIEHTACFKSNAAAAQKTAWLPGAMSEVRSVFLPVGYPDSVRAEYLRFQCFDTIQAACSYLRSILTTSAILSAAGVGEDKASPMAAAVTWVLRDGVGMFGSLLFSYAAGSNFDVYVKEWRLFADLINDVGLTLDMLAPLAPTSTSFAVLAAFGAACKTICGMVAGATRASITAHFALQGNLADVSAKESAQETAVNMVFLVIGSALAPQMGDSALTAWLAFIVLTAVHVWANVLGVGALAFDTLNPQRAVLVASAWWASSDAQSSSRRSDPQKRRASPDEGLSPTDIAGRERIYGPLLLAWRGPRVGVSLASLLETRVADGGAAQLGALHTIFRQESYLLRRSARGVPCVALKRAASGATVLKALAHCVLLQRTSAAGRARAEELLSDEWLALAASLEALNGEWEHLAASLVAAGWVEAAVKLEHVGSARVHVASEHE